MANVSKLIVYEKTREVYQFMRDGSRQTKDIVQYFTKKWTDDGFWPESTLDLSKARTIHNYIRKVKDSFLNFEKEVETERGRALARLDDLYTRNLKIQDYKTALQIIRELNVMLGHNEATKINHSGEVKAPIIINLGSDDETTE